MLVENSSHFQLPPKTERVLMSTLAASTLAGYNPYTGTSGKIPRTLEVLDHCASAIAQSLSQNGEDGNVDATVIRPLAVFLSPSQFYRPPENLLREIAMGDIGVLTYLSAHVAKNPHAMEQVVVRTVLGASEHMPLRSLSYLLPSLEYVEAMRRSGKFPILPQIQFLCMAHTGAAINALATDNVREQAQLFMKLGHAFVQDYFPELAEHVFFADDRVFFADDRIQNFVTHTISTVRASSYHFLQPAVIEEFDGLDHNRSLEYAAFHPLVHEVVLPEGMFVDHIRTRTLNTQPEVIINIGGQFEKPFYRARQVFRNAIDPELTVKSVQLFSRHSVPPYLPLTDRTGTFGVDISLIDALQHPELPGDTLQQLNKGTLLSRELNTLDNITRGDFMYFLYRSRDGIRSKIMYNKAYPEVSQREDL